MNIRLFLSTLALINIFQGSYTMENSNVLSIKQHCTGTISTITNQSKVTALDCRNICSKEEGGATSYELGFISGNQIFVVPKNAPEGASQKFGTLKSDYFENAKRLLFSSSILWAAVVSQKNKLIVCKVPPYSSDGPFDNNYLPERNTKLPEVNPDSIGWSPDGTHLAAASEDKMLIYKASSESCDLIFEWVNRQPVANFAWQPHAKNNDLAIYSSSEQILLLPISKCINNSLDDMESYAPFARPDVGFGFTHDGKNLIFKLFDPHATNSRNIVSNIFVENKTVFNLPLETSNDSITRIILHPSLPYMAVLVASSNNPSQSVLHIISTKEWDKNRNPHKIRYSIGSKEQNFVWNPRNLTLAIFGPEEPVMFLSIDIEENRLIGKIKETSFKISDPKRMTWTPDGQHLAVVDVDGKQIFLHNATIN